MAGVVSTGGIQNSDGTFTYSKQTIDDSISATAFVNNEISVRRENADPSGAITGLTYSIFIEFRQEGDPIWDWNLRWFHDVEGSQSDPFGEPVAEFGVIERDGMIHLVSPPDGPLELTRDELPPAIRDQLVTVGQLAVQVGPPQHLVEGDPLVLLDGLPVVRVGDASSFGGEVVDGSTTIFINGVPAAVVGSTVTSPFISGAGVPAVGGPILGPCPSVGGTGDPTERCVPADYPEPIDLLDRPANPGDSRIEVRDDGDFAVGDTVFIDEGEAAEMRVITGRGSLVLDRPLERAHPAGALVTRVPDAYADTAVSATEQPSVGTDSSPGGGISPLAVALAAAVGVGVIGGGTAYWLRRS